VERRLEAPLEEAEDAAHQFLLELLALSGIPKCPECAGTAGNGARVL
jgi:hypothetical protein